MSLGKAIFDLSLGAHFALVLSGAFFWIRFTRGELRRNEIRFQYNIADIYAGIAGLLPWLWMLASVLRMQDDPEPMGKEVGEGPNLPFMAWGLAQLLFALTAGWFLGVQNRLLADRGNRETFVLAFLATLLFQYLVVAVFVMLSIVYFAIVAVLIEVLGQ